MAVARRFGVLLGLLAATGGLFGVAGSVHGEPSAAPPDALVEPGASRSLQAIAAAREPATHAPSPVAERRCIRQALEEDLRLHGIARAASVRAQGQAAQGRDDRSWADHARRLEALDLTDCPAAFRAAFGAWVLQWTVIGEDARDGADWAALVPLLQDGDDALTRAAAEAGVDPPHRTWSVPTD